VIGRRTGVWPSEVPSRKKGKGGSQIEESRQGVGAKATREGGSTRRGGANERREGLGEGGRRGVGSTCWTEGSDNWGELTTLGQAGGESGVEGEGWQEQKREAARRSIISINVKRDKERQQA